MIGETDRHLTTLSPRTHTVGLLATTGTVRAGLHQEWLDRFGVRLVLPDEVGQDREGMTAIRAVKAGVRDDTATRLLYLRRTALAEQGAQAVIAGCTEVPLGLPRTPWRSPSSTRRSSWPRLWSAGPGPKAEP